MTNVDDFRDKDGNINWQEYLQAEVAGGFRCRECENFLLGPILSSRVAKPTRCGSCDDLHNSNEEWHEDDRVRCPHCRDVIVISSTDYWDSGIYDEGSPTTIECHKCEYSYEVETTITYSFKSPAMVGSDDDS